MARPANRYYASLDRNGTEDEITIYTPDGRPMLCVAFWDREEEHDPLGEYADQLKADAVLIVEALNEFRGPKILSRLKRAFRLVTCRARVMHHHDRFARYQQDGNQPSQAEKQAKAEAFAALCEARGEAPF